MWFSCNIGRVGRYVENEHKVNVTLDLNQDFIVASIVWTLTISMSGKNAYTWLGGVATAHVMQCRFVWGL